MSEKLNRILSKYPFNPQQKNQLVIADDKGLDVSCLANVRYDWEQMREIRLCLESGLDPTSFCDPDIPSESMETIRERLIEQSGIYDEKIESVHQKRLKRIIVSVVMTIVLAIVGSIAYWQKDTIALLFQELDLQLTAKKVSVGISEAANIDYMKYVKTYDNKFKLTLPSTKLTKIKTYSVQYSLSNEVKSNNQYLLIRVYDDVKPIIRLNATTVALKEGASFNYKKYISSAEDNVDGNVLDLTKSSGLVDTSKPGSQNVTIYYIDKAGNKGEEKLKVIVNAKTKESTSNTSSSSSSSSSKSKSKSSKSTGSSKKAKVHSITNVASDRSFYFSSNSDMSATYSKAQSYAENQLSSGHCNGYNINPISSDGIYKGYRVEFN